MPGPSSRMLTLLSLLQARRDWPGGVLADRLGVTTRTVRRDVDRLRELGYRVRAVHGPAGGYRLEAGSELPPLLLDDEQAVAIAVALQDAAATGVDIGEAAERALATVRQVMPSRLRHRVDHLRIPGSEPADHPVDPAVLEAVGRAVQDRTALRVAYGDPGAPTRHVEPHGLVPRAGRWYLVAWDLDRAGWRLFRLDRLTPRTPAGPRFAPREIPTGDARTFVAARSKGSSDEDRWPCVGQVEVDLPARDVAPWYPDGTVEPLGDRTCLLTVGSWSWTGVLAHVLRLDAPFRVVGPAGLVTAARVLAVRLHDAGAPGDAG